MSSRWLFVAVVVLVLIVSSPVLAQEDAHIGVWKQNFAKSKLVPPPAGPQPQSITRTYEKFGDGLKATFVTISADGKRTTVSYSAHFDGKDSPYTGTTAIDTIALKKIDNHSFSNVNKKAGKVVNTGTNVVSKDGKTMTFTSKGTNAQGQPTSGVSVFEKQ
jgi:hypothetical protein